MPTVGYIMVYNQYPSLDEDRTWMKNFGCDDIVEEHSEFEKTRPKWKALLDTLRCNDTLVIPKLSNVVESASELSFFLDYCRREKIRLISIHDKLDSMDGYYSPRSTSDIIDIIASIPNEVAAIKYASRRVAKIKKICLDAPGKILDKNERNNRIINLYKTGVPINEIWKMSGFRSRSSVFRILRDKGIVPSRYNERKPHKTGDDADVEK